VALREYEKRYKKKLKPTKQEIQSARLQAKRNVDEIDMAERESLEMME
jgi:hypothetical protein